MTRGKAGSQGVAKRDPTVSKRDRDEIEPLVALLRFAQAEARAPPKRSARAEARVGKRKV